MISDECHIQYAQGFLGLNMFAEARTELRSLKNKEGLFGSDVLLLLCVIAQKETEHLTLLELHKRASAKTTKALMIMPPGCPATSIPALAASTL